VSNRTTAEADVLQTETNRKARFYAATSAGRRQLARDKDAWDRMAGIIHTLLHGAA
jgi:DNA-binding PadR family transcriptional regulator